MAQSGYFVEFSETKQVTWIPRVTECKINSPSYVGRSMMRQMKMIVQSRGKAALLMFAGFFGLLAGIVIFAQSKPYGLSMAHAIGAVSFFCVACFLPERPEKSFYSRQSALGGVGLFSWLAVGHLPTFFEWNFSSEGNLTAELLLFIGIPALIAVGIFWFSLFAIRGFRAKPEYEMASDDVPRTDDTTHSITRPDTAHRRI